MGKGDKKSKKGKIFMGSFGVTRLKKAKKSTTVTNTGEGTTKVTTEKKGGARKVKAKKED